MTITNYIHICFKRTRYRSTKRLQRYLFTICDTKHACIDVASIKFSLLFTYLHQLELFLFLSSRTDSEHFSMRNMTFQISFYRYLNRWMLNTKAVQKPYATNNHNNLSISDGPANIKQGQGKNQCASSGSAYFFINAYFLQISSAASHWKNQNRPGVPGHRTDERRINRYLIFCYQASRKTATIVFGHK